ncbi:MAG: hypothetical protein KME55_05290 [Nostoc indistinguendum CM1-VF10]|jgi:hypothetical protein|nr:hypothetical protein [Nostoc indistinguendum CM1-VF10]
MIPALLLSVVETPPPTFDKLESIKLLESYGWTKADAMCFLEVIDFSANPDEITIRRAISPFAGSELTKRQRLQVAQKGLVTRKTREIELKDKYRPEIFYNMFP